MHDREVGGDRAVYDYELEHAHEGARRRRPVADWGVGEEMFDHMPRRRFARAAEPQRRHAHGREAGMAPRFEGEALSPERPHYPAGSAAPAGDRSATPVAAPRAPARPSVVPGSAPRIEAPDGRRTIVIGRSREATTTLRPPRRPRTAGERLGHRPDRIAMWAVAMGFLLILIAILSAH